MPFLAMMWLSPPPSIVFSWTYPLEPVLSMVGPFFWYLSITLRTISALPVVISVVLVWVGARPTWIATPSWQPRRVGMLSQISVMWFESILAEPPLSTRML